MNEKHFEDLMKQVADITKEVSDLQQMLNGGSELVTTCTVETKSEYKLLTSGEITLEELNHLGDQGWTLCGQKDGKSLFIRLRQVTQRRVIQRVETIAPLEKF